jgi:hypothetical protein
MKPPKGITVFSFYNTFDIPLRNTWKKRKERAPQNNVILSTEMGAPRSMFVMQVLCKYDYKCNVLKIQLDTLFDSFLIEYVDGVYV